MFRKTVTVNLGPRSYDVMIAPGALHGERIPVLAGRRAVIVTGEGVPEIYARAAAAHCREASVYRLPDGEPAKCFGVLEALLSHMLAANLTREDCLVAVGGGTVGDLAGFAASVYMRGIDYIQIPTTLLAQVDASVGGKTAVNFCGVKNAVGSFFQPRSVLIDPDTLRTLPQRQFRSGLAEIIKIAAIADASLFRRLEAGDARDAGAPGLAEALTRAVEIKKDFVEADERESGIRRALNFGHTLGHAIESAAGLGGLLHGEAVGIGMLYMSTGDAYARIRSLLLQSGLPVSHGIRDLGGALLHDKKMTENGIVTVHVDTVGSYRMEILTSDALRLLAAKEP